MGRFAAQALFVVLVACAPNRAESPRISHDDAPRWGGLDVVERGRGNVTVVLMHGYGAPGDDLVALGEELSAEVPARFVMPAAPRIWQGGPPGRAWFEREPSLARAQLPAASRAVDGVIATLVDEGVPASRLVLAGFSQGAMMALERSLRGPATPRAIVLLSGGAIRGVDDGELDWSRLANLPVFVSHGRQDPILPFSGAETMVQRAEAAGARVTFVPFDGGHSIPPVVRREVTRFLREVVAR